MEKRNVVEPRRTPCRKGFVKDTFCDCEDCLKANRNKKASENSVNVHDIDGLARLHK